MMILKVAPLLVLLLVGCAQSSAREAARVARRDGEPNGGGLAAQADELMKEGDATRAAQYYEAAYRAGAARVLPKLLAACVASRQYALAIEHAEAALARDPSDGRLRVLLGSLHADTGALVKAREHFELAASERPGDPDLQFTVAVFFRDDAHEPGRADGYFRAYLAIAPTGTHSREAQASLMKTVQ